MYHGVTMQSLVSVRSKPNHEAEQVTQLLFGEMYVVHEQKENWLRIKTSFDNYDGWIHEKQHAALSDPETEKLKMASRSIAAELVQTVINNDKNFPILIGSTLYDFDGMNFKLGKEKFVYSGQAVNEKTELLNGEHIRKFALKFLHAPYQWGGRSPFGIDCSGFTQIVFKLYGITLPRDAYQQSESGRTINFITEAKEGDLAFFDNDEEKITHTGIILSNDLIIHSAGKVRIDSIDHFGIYNKDLKKYTHKLRIIKRLV
ncbi:MAG: NlpC/P60 family protein [Chitinophagales bacterium]